MSCSNSAPVMDLMIVDTVNCFVIINQIIDLKFKLESKLRAYTGRRASNFITLQETNLREHLRSGSELKTAGAVFDALSHGHVFFYIILRFFKKFLE